VREVTAVYGTSSYITTRLSLASAYVDMYEGRDFTLRKRNVVGRRKNQFHSPAGCAAAAAAYGSVFYVASDLILVSA